MDIEKKDYLIPNWPIDTSVIETVCSYSNEPGLGRAYRLSELSSLIGRTPKYILRKFIQPIMNNQIEYLYKDMVNHPDQAYVSIRK